MNSARENILGRVRSALREPAHHPLTPSPAAIFAPITDGAARFRQEFATLRGEWTEDLPAFVRAFARVATDTSDIVRETYGPGNAPVHEADLGITGCDFLVAQTGSIIVSTRSTGGRAVSVLPPVHLVIARRDQLVPDLATAMTRLHERYTGHWPSSLSMITGPSRTADIEKILVMGAHGPKRLVLHWVG